MHLKNCVCAEDASQEVNLCSIHRYLHIASYKRAYNGQEDHSLNLQHYLEMMM